MFWNDHMPPHFHAEYGDKKVLVDIVNGTVIKGVFPFKKLQNISLFKDACTVMNDTLAWDISGNYDPSDCLDLDPEELYNSCPEVKEPDIINA
jgi:hypothetical protein